MFQLSIVGSDGILDSSPFPGICSITGNITSDNLGQERDDTAYSEVASQ